MTKHIVLYGDRQVGKSTLVDKLVSDVKVPLYGFITKAFPNPDTGINQIHMFRPGDHERIPTPSNHLADCDSVQPFSAPAGFESFGVQFLKEVQPGGIVILDELGFLEANAPVFCDLVLNLLDGDIPLLAVTKNGFNNVPFLNAVRKHPRVDLIAVDRENRDELFLQLRPVIEDWQKELQSKHPYNSIHQ